MLSVRLSRLSGRFFGSTLNIFPVCSGRDGRWDARESSDAIFAVFRNLVPPPLSLLSCQQGVGFFTHLVKRFVSFHGKN